MRAAKAARQATGIVATRSPLLQLCFADQKRPSFAFSPPKFSLLFFFIGVCYFQAAYSCIIVEYRYSVGGGAYSRNMHMHMCVFSYHWLRVDVAGEVMDPLPRRRAVLAGASVEQ